MNQAPLPRNEQPDDRVAEHSTVSKILYWLAGVSAGDMARLSARTRLKVATLGFVFGLGLVVLVWAWVHVGVTYFGPWGVLVPGLAVPAAMVLGLDRLMAMQPRRLTGELAAYNQVEPPGEAAARKSQHSARIGIAVVFSAVTVQTLLLSLSQADIQQAHRDSANKANSQLRSTFEQRVQSDYTLNEAALSQRLAELQSERATVVTESAQADAAAKSAEETALQAQSDASREAGGLEGRTTGTGPKYRAQSEIAAYSRAEAVKKRLQTYQLRQRVGAIDQSIKTVNEQRNSLRKSTDASLRAVPEAIKADPTYVAVKAGLFADSSALLRLYLDPDKALGYWALTILGVPFLFAIECLPLLGLSMYGSSPYDVYRMAQNRAEAAGSVAEAELLIARRHATMPPVGVAYPRHAGGLGTAAAGGFAAPGGAAAPGQPAPGVQANEKTAEAASAGQPQETGG